MVGERREELCWLVKEHALLRREFTLSSGITRSHYFDLLVEAEVEQC